MNTAERQESVPLNMRYLILAASFLCLPLLVAEQRLLMEREILCSFVGYMAGPYLALAPLSYKIRFMIGSASGVVPYLLSFNMYMRAFFLGLIVSYYRMVIDLFCSALCVRTRKKTVVVMANLVASWISFITFFSLHFCPSLASFICTPVFSIIFAFIGTAVSYMYIIETPEEIFHRFRENSEKSSAYEDLYSCISYLNGPDAPKPEEFREEYKVFLDKKNQLEESFTFKEKLSAIFITVNISFIYIAFQRASGVENRYSLYRIFLGAMHLFSWSFKYYTSSSSAFYAAVIPPMALYFVCVSTNNTQDIFLVFIMLLGINFVPKTPHGYTLTPIDIAFSRSIQYFFVLISFLIIMFAAL
ncbi:hypothetical protein NEMIN01_0988 [Nematocida minor]|uniref:uncharacterized protein n=1 Tax=Nematocida minor TaxID=1912983 RepID=UPI00221F010B|nr:uncharacterized protein NEMIN01_0988 [Nematocida minor]KAI5190289.1 hypothetical protein NEMIN01_0988 [Nematocida minor]